MDYNFEPEAFDFVWHHTGSMKDICFAVWYNRTLKGRYSA